MAVGLLGFVALTWISTAILIICQRETRVAESELNPPAASLVTNSGEKLETWQTSLLFSLAACGGALLILALVNRGSAEGITHLISVIGTVLHGNPKTRAALEKCPGLRELAVALNEMIDAWQRAEARTATANESLDLKVHSRTAELWRANKALRDESEQRAKAEREFQQAQKMDALGKLAGSIVHDFNNLLTIILGSAECARQRIGFNHSAASMLQTIEQAAERAAALTRPLLAFSRSQVISLEPVDLNEAATEASNMLQRLIGVNIKVRLALRPGIRMVRTNANQLQQVLINLGVNARDAMNGAGILTITTREMVTASGENWIELSVSDTGCGMDAVTKARIFEPFFTTKPVGKGTGLGLATVFGIINQGGGQLDVESEPGHGTTFRVLLPPATDEEMAAFAAKATPVKLADENNDGHGTLLLVDDEPEIRELAALTLEGRGYTILAASNAEEALAHAEKHAGEIRALITDVVMPGLSGLQLAEMLMKKMPNLRVLFVSGHSNDAVSPNVLGAGKAEYLQKPYRGDDLAARVKQLLTHPGSDASTPIQPEGASAVLARDFGA